MIDELLLKRTMQIKKTCPIYALEDKCLTFAKDGIMLNMLRNETKEVDIIVPKDAPIILLPPNIYVHRVDDVKSVYIPLHNMINKDKEPMENSISPLAYIHPTAVIGVPGNNITKLKDGRIINMKHMGNVVIESYAEVQAQSVIHRGVFASTIIRRNAQIFSLVNIGHNCYIGDSTIICPGSMIAGGTKIGRDCYIWQGVVTRSNVKICDNVIIGAGSLVLDDITKPGVYYGSPAKYVKPYDEAIR
jgi:acetyltransferase-like isoleucine patch superfamily enzyme